MIDPDDDTGSLVVPVVLALGILFTLFWAVIGLTQERSYGVETGKRLRTVAGSSECEVPEPQQGERWKHWRQGPLGEEVGS